jgi:hypothetical protein
MGAPALNKRHDASPKVGRATFGRLGARVAPAAAPSDSQAKLGLKSQHK